MYSCLPPTILMAFHLNGLVPQKNGKANGNGIAIKYKNGKFESKYEGAYKNGIREGKGTFTHADGSVIHMKENLSTTECMEKELCTMQMVRPL